VIDNEIAGWINRFGQGIDVNQKSLAFDIIASVGPGGNYLYENHTVEGFRREHLFSALLDRGYQLSWPEHESESVVAKAREKAQAVLSAESAGWLPEDARREIQSILNRVGGTRNVFQ
jgi:trimethylamine--corrinoid protein Co-methyltransferase